MAVSYLNLKGISEAVGNIGKAAGAVGSSCMHMACDRGGMRAWHARCCQQKTGDASPDPGASHRTDCQGSQCMADDTLALAYKTTWSCMCGRGRPCAAPLLPRASSGELPLAALRDSCPHSDRRRLQPACGVEAAQGLPDRGVGDWPCGHVRPL